ncbi:unnamed protein product, partial [Rotaria sp. Silwood2]
IKILLPLLLACSKHLLIYRKSTPNSGGYDNYSSSASRAGYGDIQTGRGMNSARR